MWESCESLYQCYDSHIRYYKSHVHVWMCNEIKGSYDKIIITIVPSYTRKNITHLLPLALLLMLHPRNNTDSNKQVRYSFVLWWYLYIACQCFLGPYWSKGALLEQGEEEPKSSYPKNFLSKKIEQHIFWVSKVTKCHLRILRGGHTFRFLLYGQQLHSQPGTSPQLLFLQKQFSLAKLQDYLCTSNSVFLRTYKWSVFSFLDCYLHVPCYHTTNSNSCDRGLEWGWLW